MQLKDYIPTQHFIDRAQERFSIIPENIATFIKQNNQVTDTHLSLDSTRITAISNNGIIFILDQMTDSIVTTYKAIDPNIGNEQRALFEAQLKQLIDQQQLNTAKLYLTEIEQTIDTFYRDIKSITQATTIDARQHNTLEHIYHNMAIIRTTLNLLTKQNDYYESYNLTKTDLSKHQKLTKTINSMNQMNDIQLQTINTQVIEVDSPKETYQPKTSNSDLLKDKTPLNQILTSNQKQAINNWFNKQKTSSTASSAMQAIKKGCTKTELLAHLRNQLSFILYQKFEQFLNSIIK